MESGLLLIMDAFRSKLGRGGFVSTVTGTSAVRCVCVFLSTCVWAGFRAVGGGLYFRLVRVHFLSSPFGQGAAETQPS